MTSGRFLAIPMVACMFLVGCSGEDGDVNFEDLGRELQEQLPEIAHRLEGAEFTVERHLHEFSCASDWLGESHTQHTRYVAGLVAEVPDEDQAVGILDQAEDVFNEYGWELAGRYDDRERVNNDRIEWMNFHRIGDDGTGMSLALNYELAEKEHVLSMTLRSECVDHGDSRRESKEYPLEL